MCSIRWISSLQRRWLKRLWLWNCCVSILLSNSLQRCPAFAPTKSSTSECWAASRVLSNAVEIWGSGERLRPEGCSSAASEEIRRISLKALCWANLEDMSKQHQWSMNLFGVIKIDKDFFRTFAPSENQATGPRLRPPSRYLRHSHPLPGDNGWQRYQEYHGKFPNFWSIPIMVYHGGNGVAYPVFLMYVGLQVASSYTSFTRQLHLFFPWYKASASQHPASN